MRQEIRLSGFGGQGIVLAGVILGKAASIYENKFAVHTQSYGPAARGGACKSDVIIGDDAVRYPKVRDSDVLVAFSQIAYDKYKKQIHDAGGTLIINSDLVDMAEEDMTYYKKNNITVFEVNAMKIATELGAEIAVNMVMLGVLSAVTDVVSKGSLLKAIKSSMPVNRQELNLAAVNTGFEAGAKLKK